MHPWNPPKLQLHCLGTPRRWLNRQAFGRCLEKYHWFDHVCTQRVGELRLDLHQSRTIFEMEVVANSQTLALETSGQTSLQLCEAFATRMCESTWAKQGLDSRNLNYNKGMQCRKLPGISENIATLTGQQGHNISCLACQNKCSKARFGWTILIVAMSEHRKIQGPHTLSKPGSVPRCRLKRLQVFLATQKISPHLMRACLGVADMYWLCESLPGWVHWNLKLLTQRHALWCNDLLTS